jgi:hypothetical protein
MNLICRIASRWISRIAASYPDDGVIYTAVFLDRMSHQRLLKRFGQEHPDLQAHHMTIWFYDAPGTPLERLPLGRTVSLKVVGYASDEKAQAAVVVPPTGLRRSDAGIEHVTISTAPGVSPFYSNTLLSHRWDAEEAKKGFPALTGKVGWWDGSRIRFDLPA